MPSHLAHTIIDEVGFGEFSNGIFSPKTSELILRFSYGGCHSKSTDEKSHSGLKSKRFDSKKYRVGI